MKSRLKELTEQAGVHMDSYSPRDGVTRYRFFNKPMDYFSGGALFTALGRKEAETWLKGYIAHEIAYHAMTGE